jgi:hypothetical protein
MRSAHGPAADKQEMIKLIRAAHDRGVTLFDTAESDQMISTVPRGKLDDLVASHMEERLLQPKRLKTILANLLLAVSMTPSRLARSTRMIQCSESASPVPRHFGIREITPMRGFNGNYSAAILSCVLVLKSSAS